MQQRESLTSRIRAVDSTSLRLSAQFFAMMVITGCAGLLSLGDPLTSLQSAFCTFMLIGAALFNVLLAWVKIK
jgi:hypothetical protein